MKNSFLAIISIVLMISSCSKNDDDVQPITFPTASNAISNIESAFISNTYSANASDPLKINISTTIEVTLNDDNYTSGLFLVTTQNFRYRNSFGFFDPGTLKDTLFISNHTARQFVLNGTIEYINTSYIIEEPEVIVHDRNFSFFSP